jgi:hypothetical protein
MPRRAKAKGLHHRGRYWLDWDERADGTRRSPFLTIFWYDDERGRIRSASTGTVDEGQALRALILKDLADHGGGDLCPTCGQRKPAEATPYFVTNAINEYRAVKDDTVLDARLDHVVDYIATLPSAEIKCEQVDEDWVAAFRTWSAAQPVVFSSGRFRDEPRAPSTTENSVIALQSAINQAEWRKRIPEGARFTPIQTKVLNRTPYRRLSIDEIAAAFRYASDPRFPVKRQGLHRFLMLSVGTAARPDAAHDVSTERDRRQWNADRSVLALNPAGRRQTKKYRATVIAPWQLAHRLDEVKGFFVEAVSVRSAWDSMCDDLGWPRDREFGMKIVRRSVAQLLRDAGTKRAWSEEWRDQSRKVPSEEIELQLGHRKLDSVTDLYAAFDPDYLANATRAIEAIIDEIEARVPGAFHRTDTGEAPKIVPIRASKKAR